MSQNNKKNIKKNKEIQINKINYVLSLLIALLVGAGLMYFANQRILNYKDTAKVIDSESHSQYFLDQTDELSSVNKMFEVLKNNYYEELDSEILIEGALNGMAQAVGDPYTEYMNEVETASFEEDVSGSFQGIGAEVMKDEDAVRIVSPIANSPAEKVGLQANDLILEIDRESIADLSLNEAVSLIRGPEGSDVELLIQRDEDQFTVTITRAEIPVETVIYKIDETDKSIGHVNIVNFNMPTYEETVEAIKELEKQGVTKIIFDVRGNPGGLLSTALEISNIFVPDGEPLVMTESREDKEPIVYYADSEEYGDFKFDGEAVLLVDQGSASASEILAGAMKSVGIPVYGETTFGKGTVQSVTPLREEDEIKFTNGKWLTAEGEWINEKGITPDKQIELPKYSKLFVVTSNDTFTKDQKSSEIKNLNSVLNALDYDVSENDVYSEKTIEAIKKFQVKHGLEVSGDVTKDTARLLTEALRSLIEDNDTQYEKARKDLQ